MATQLPMTRKASETARPLVFSLEPNEKVQEYQDQVLKGICRLRQFAQPSELCDALHGGEKPEVVLFAWDGADASMHPLTMLRTVHPQIPIAVTSCSSEPGDYETFTRLGVTAVILKPFVDDNLSSTMGRLLEAFAGTGKAETKEIDLGEGRAFVRSSQRMRDLEKQAAMVARSDIPVLVLGESGTGKEIIAMFIHKMSRRSTRMFLKINCAAMPAELLESELFGYEQGAFTGAVKMKPGKFETCNGGTIFLDEIGEMPAILQAKLLHVLQDGTYSRLGGRVPMRTDVRVIAATNVNMKEAMARKTFREDLYYRLNGLSLVLPPLRERTEEIPALAAYFLRKGAEKYGMDPMPLSSSLLEAFSRYSWPGNLRELENVINRMLILRDEKAILAELNPAPPPQSGSARTLDDTGLKHLVRGVKGEAESLAIANALEQKGWNRKAAASDLQISYKALLYKIKQYDLSPRA